MARQVKPNWDVRETDRKRLAAIRDVTALGDSLPNGAAVFLLKQLDVAVEVANRENERGGEARVALSRLPQQLREEFVRFLTVDSKPRDARRREFNQAIFDAEEGWACFNGTDLDMVLEKFDKAVKSVKRRTA